MSDEPQRPTGDDRDEWKAYWTAQGMPWRTEPEIDAERQRYLAGRRDIPPDIEKGVYPFKGTNLDRADVEWLLATHESGGQTGPVDWNDDTQRGRDGLDLRGANLQRADLTGLWLAKTRGGVSPAEWNSYIGELRREAAAHFEGAEMRHIHLEGQYYVARTSAQLTA